MRYLTLVRQKKNICIILTHINMMIISLFDINEVRYL